MPPTTVSGHERSDGYDAVFLLLEQLDVASRKGLAIIGSGMISLRCNVHLQYCDCRSRVALHFFMGLFLTP